MRDSFSWSLPAGRYFGITVRVHWLFWVMAIAIVMRATSTKNGVTPYPIEALWMIGILFVSVLLHEFGHCFGARYVEGDASDILMWPLGGLAYVDVPNTPRAHFITVICGPLVNLVLCLVSTAVLAGYGFLPPSLFNLFYDVIWLREGLYNFSEGKNLPIYDQMFVPVLMTRLFVLNWMLFVINIFICAFPLDGGRLLQCVLWVYLGLPAAMRYSIQIGMIWAIGLGIYVFIFDPPQHEAMMVFSLAIFIYLTCWQQRFLMETGALGEDGVFGYDFSQGYTSLERDAPSPRRAKRKNFVQRWLQRKAEQKRQRVEAQRIEEDRRVDELLAKVQQGGMQSLTDEEQRFLKRVSAKLRNRDRS